MYQYSRGVLGDIPPVTKNLIIINTLVWLASIVLPRVGIDLYKVLGLHYVIGENFYPHQLITYMFMHDKSSITHLFFNMFSLYMFGRSLELVWGQKRFLIFYFVTGIGAGIIQELAWTYELRDLLLKVYEDLNAGVISSIREFGINEGGVLKSVVTYLGQLNTVGASGAVFGLLLAFGMIFPNSDFFVMFIPIPIKAKYFVVIYGAIELIGGVSNFSFDNVAHFAHLGGMLFGYLLIKYWNKKGYNNGQYFY